MTRSATASASQGPVVTRHLRASRSTRRNNAMRRREHDNEIFRPQATRRWRGRAAARERMSAPQRGVEGEYPASAQKRQLNHIVVELGRGIIEIMQAIDDEHGDKRAGSARPWVARSTRPAQSAPITASWASA